MIQGKKVLALIPARGGSKGVPGKNIRLLGDKPLLAWTIEAAKKSRYIDKMILSSDDDLIIEVGRQWGCEVPFRRPKELAGDSTPTMDAVFHALEQVPSYDKLVLLQATSPLRSVEDIDLSLEKSLQSPFCVSVVENSESPFWSYFTDENMRMKPVISSSTFTRRQDIPKTYIANGAIYIADIEALKREKTFFTKETLAYIMPSERSVDIDTLDDFEFLEFKLRKNSEEVFHAE